MSDQELCEIVTAWLEFMRAGLTRGQIEAALGEAGVRLWEAYHRA